VRSSEEEPEVGASSSALRRQRKEGLVPVEPQGKRRRRDLETWLGVSERVGLGFRSFTRRGF